MLHTVLNPFKQVTIGPFHWVI